MSGWLSFVALAGGTVLSAVAVARTDPTVEGWISTYQANNLLLLLGVLLIGIGIWIRRRALAAAAQDSNASGGSLATLTSSIEKMMSELDALNKKAGDLSLDEIHAQIDHLVSGPVADFADNRQAITDRFGMAAYAEVMGPFAQGERYLNRAWSASADGYLDEAVEYVKRAGPQLGEMQAAMRGLQTS